MKVNWTNWAWVYKTFFIMYSCAQILHTPAIFRLLWAVFIFSVLIIHIYEFINGRITCIEDMCNVANRTRQLCRRVQFAKQCRCPKSSCTVTNAQRIVYTSLVKKTKHVECTSSKDAPKKTENAPKLTKAVSQSFTETVLESNSRWSLSRHNEALARSSRHCGWYARVCLY